MKIIVQFYRCWYKYKALLIPLLLLTILLLLVAFHHHRHHYNSNNNDDEIITNDATSDEQNKQLLRENNNHHHHQLNDDFIEQLQNEELSPSSSSSVKLPPIAKEPIVNMLKRLASHRPFQPSLPHSHNGSVWNVGNEARLEYALLKVLTSIARNQSAATISKRKGVHLAIAAAGGSVTVGHGVWNVQDVYFSKLGKWLTESLKTIGISAKFDNVANGGTASNYYAMCLDENIYVEDYDVFLVDFLTTDYDAEGSLEELIRTVWRLNPYTHIVYLNLMVPVVALGMRVNPNPLDSPFVSWDIIERIDLEIIRHYQLPGVRWTHILGDLRYDRNASTAVKRLRLAEQYSSEMDFWHQNPLTHGYAAEFIYFYFQKVFSGLAEKLSSMEPSKSLDDLLADYRKSILKERASYEKKPVVYSNTTWLDDVECFATSTRGNVKNEDRLTSAITAHSSDAGPITNTEDWRVKYGPRNWQAGLQFIGIGNVPGTSFMQLDFNKIRPTLAVKKCKNDYVPRLAIAYNMCGRECTPHHEMKILANFTYEDGSSILNVSYLMPLKSYKAGLYQVTFADPPSFNHSGYRQITSKIHQEDRQRFCLTNKKPLPLKSVGFRLEQITNVYPLSFHGFIIAYDCC